MFCDMYLVFSQDPRLQPDWERLSAHAEKFFGAKVELVRRTAARTTVKVTSSRPLFASELTIDVRVVTEEISPTHAMQKRGAVQAGWVPWLKGAR